MSLTLELLGARLLATSAQTGLLVLVVWLLCRYTRRLPPSTQCALWWLVALQSVIGLIWASPLQLPLLPATDAAMTAVVPLASGTITTAPTTIAVPLQPKKNDWSWEMVLMAIWLVGVAVGGIRTLVALRCSRDQLRAAQPCCDEKINDELALVMAECGVRRAPRVVLSNRIDSPQLIGPWRPVLMLPIHALQRMDRNQLQMALTHELVHLRRHDLWLGLVPALAKHLFFFNPAMHLAVREYGISREAAVDAEVVAGDRHCRQRYGRLLLQLGVASRPCTGLASASPTFLSLKRRLLMLQDTSSFSRFGAGLILTAVALMGVLPMRLVAKPALLSAAATSITGDDYTGMPIDGKVQDKSLPEATSSAQKTPVGYKSHEYESITLLTDELDGESPSNADGHALIYKDKLLLSDSSIDLSSVEPLDDGKGLLWVRRDGREYVIRDGTLLDRFQTLYVDEIRLGYAQARLEEQEHLLDKQSNENGQRSGGNAAQQIELGEQQAELGRQQAAASAKANREAEQMIRQAINSGIARPVGG
ncbi:hypothetical protein ABB27_13135 [Stenotrophomonas terrae]|uniref:Peptidase M56 domain-containing protein n=1 Tax=Stenotrophomonas terrae TaxID=405446 RepID=A0A0R0CAP1_9GAMM|nr:M56 family metallopeptidase [Stenotrophomonas terrae]KRG66649.1 hypothetical protein ABB27_13135 [Stenotrophomonas terrae]